MALADNFIVHPAFVDTPRRSLPVASTTTNVVTGRWYARNSSGNLVAPTAAAPGAYWILEGTTVHVGSLSEYSSGVSTNYVWLPSNAESKTCTAVYGNFVATVGSEGVVPTGTYAVGDKLTVDALGRLIVTTTAGDAIYGIVEAVSASGAVTSLTFRAVGQGTVA